MSRWSAARDAAWSVIEGCGASGVLVAAGGSALYPHVWARDVGVAAAGICAEARRDTDATALIQSLRLLAAAQDDNGRIPLKVDPRSGREVPENSAGVDTGVWFVLAVDAVARRFGDAAGELTRAAGRALSWTACLDLTGTGLLISPEASDWADMLPHRHHVLGVNVLHAAALDAASRLAARWPADFADTSARYAQRASWIRERVRLRFQVQGVTSPEAAAARLRELGDASFEWGLTGQDATVLGDLPYLLPYVDFRRAGRHCDVAGNLLAVRHGIFTRDQARRFLDHLEAVGAGDPWPTVAIDPPIYPGAADHRDYFHWRALNHPHQYQNGGSWPFIGSWHVVAELRAGRPERAERLLSRLCELCLEDDFPEWCHGRSGAPMGERRQLWSATGVLEAVAAFDGGGGNGGV